MYGNTSHTFLKIMSDIQVQLYVPLRGTYSSELCKITYKT